MTTRDVDFYTFKNRRQKTKQPELQEFLNN